MTRNKLIGVYKRKEQSFFLNNIDFIIITTNDIFFFYIFSPNISNSEESYQRNIKRNVSTTKALIWRKAIPLVGGRIVQL